MGFHLYCILPAPSPVPPGLAGLADRRPLSIPADDLTAWASEHDAPPQPDLEAVRRHNDVIVAAMSTSVTPVPVRFGQWCATRDAVAEGIRARALFWTERLGQFAGRAEYGVRVLGTQDAERDVHAAAPESGRDYMAELARKQARSAARRAEGERIASLVAQRLGSLAAQKVEPGAGPVVVSLAHLVAWDDAEEYHVAMREIRDAKGDTRWNLSGPWPPWSFVE